MTYTLYSEYQADKKIKDHARYLATKDVYIARAAHWRETHPTEVKAYWASYYQKNAEHLKAKAKVRNQAAREAVKASTEKEILP